MKKKSQQPSEIHGFSCYFQAIFAVWAVLFLPFFSPIAPWIAQVMRPHVGDRCRLCGMDFPRKDMDFPRTVRQISKLDSLGFKRQPLGLKAKMGKGNMWCLTNVVFKMWMGGGWCVVLRNMGKQVIVFFFVCVIFLGKEAEFPWFCKYLIQIRMKE